MANPVLQQRFRGIFDATLPSRGLGVPISFSSLRRGDTAVAQCTMVRDANGRTEFRLRRIVVLSRFPLV